MVLGLAINFDRTKLVKTPASRDRRLNWDGYFGIYCSHTFTALDMYFHVNNMEQETDDNSILWLKSIQTIMKTLESRCLICYGEAKTVKSFMESKHALLLLSLPNPGESRIKI